MPLRGLASTLLAVIALAGPQLAAGSGAGAARGSPVILVTRLSARRVPKVDAADRRAEVLRAIAKRRGELGRPPLHSDAKLDRLAGEEANRAEPTPQHVLAAARPLTWREEWATVLELNEPSELSVPERALAADFDRIGVGVRQDERADPRKVTVVILVVG